jgi:hypothetical protein
VTYVYHEMDVYRTELYLARRPSEWRALRKKIDAIDDDVPNCAGMTHFLEWEPATGQRRHIEVFWIDTVNADNVAQLINTCAHEATHAASSMFNWLGHHLNGDEPSAYLVGWLTEWLWDNTSPARGWNQAT